MTVRRGAVLTAAVLAGAIAIASPPAGASRLLLFGGGELGSSDISFFPQWTSALSRQAAEPGLWDTAFAGLRDAGVLERIRAVNDAVNRVPYAEDQEIWGVPDHWSTPAEFYAWGGDCEDFAIAKYMALRHLGFAAANLRIVIVEDERRDVSHAVLAVYVDDSVLILDNLRDRPARAEEIRDYHPFYSINEDGWWLH